MAAACRNRRGPAVDSKNPPGACDGLKEPPGRQLRHHAVATRVVPVEIRRRAVRDSQDARVVSDPLGVLTLVVLGVILFGITTATESAAVSATGAFLMA